MPRSNGPATARIAIDRPNGAPLYGPVRYTGPDSANGCGPAPDLTLDVPIREASGHVPFAASLSPHSGTLDSTPSMPGGWRTDRRDRNCWRSSRVTVTVNGENAPACVSWVPAANPRLNGGACGHAPPAPSASTVNALSGVAAG